MERKEIFAASDLRHLDEETIIRDKKRGYDLENCRMDGIDVSYLVVKTEGLYASQKLWIYVKLEDHSFLFSKRPDERRPNDPRQRMGKTLSHSLLAKGKPIIGAGECEIDENCKIILVNNKSGHYKPEFKNLEESIKNMKEKNLVTDTTKYYFIKGNIEQEIK